MASKEVDGPGAPSTAAKNRFHGQVAIVTGGASGIGLATVKRLASEGAAVAVFDINQPAGESLVADPALKNLNVSYYNIDVTDKAQCAEGVKLFAEANGEKIHYLVNSVAYFGSKGLNAKKEDWDKSFSVNVRGYANMVQACNTYMKQTAGDKSIVNVASVSGSIAQPSRWTYSATKGGVHAMTRCMALDLAKDKIRVNSISPAWVWTPEVAKAAANGGRAKWEPVWGPFHMLNRLSEASEVASAITFLLSEDASFITATNLRVDGGYVSMGPEGHGDKSVFAGSEY